jgi:uncharacterized spore protein YtfJ
MEPKELVDTKPIERLVENLGAKSVFGEPTKEHDAVVIPVAQVTFGFGYGGGHGEGQAEAEEPAAEGAGGGGGAGGRATPRGYIRITAGDVKYEPIEDEKSIALAGILMGAWSIFWIMATVRHIAKMIAKTKQAKK